MSDYMLMALIATACVAITSAFWVIFSTQRIYDLRLENVENMEEANAEIIHLRDTLAGREIRDRVLSSTPVGRLMENGGNDD